MRNTRNTIMFFIFLLSAVVVGSLVAYLAEGVSFLSWLAYGQSFGVGVSSPMTVDLGVLTLTFGAGINLNIAVIICIAISMAIYGALYGRR